MASGRKSPPPLPDVVGNALLADLEHQSRSLRELVSLLAAPAPSPAAQESALRSVVLEIVNTDVRTQQSVGHIVTRLRLRKRLDRQDASLQARLKKVRATIRDLRRAEQALEKLTAETAQRLKAAESARATPLDLEELERFSRKIGYTMFGPLQTSGGGAVHLFPFPTLEKLQSSVLHATLPGARQAAAGDRGSNGAHMCARCCRPAGADAGDCAGRRAATHSRGPVARPPLRRGAAPAVEAPGGIGAAGPAQPGVIVRATVQVPTLHAGQVQLELNPEESSGEDDD